jgi:hypothetical protein
MPTRFSQYWPIFSSILVFPREDADSEGNLNGNDACVKETGPVGALPDPGIPTGGISMVPGGGWRDV